VTVPYGYPGRSFFMHGVRICVAWGFSESQAVRRCVRKVQKTERDVGRMARGAPPKDHDLHRRRKEVDMSDLMFALGRVVVRGGKIFLRLATLFMTV
jgi:hypothetical protein